MVETACASVISCPNQIGIIIVKNNTGAKEQSALLLARNLNQAAVL